MACLPRSARISLLEPVTWSIWRRPMMSTVSSKPFSASRNPSLERALSSIYRLEHRLMRERRHHLLGEAPQRLNPAGGVKKQIFRTDVLERLELGDDLVGRTVEGARFGGLVCIRVGHDARSCSGRPDVARAGLCAAVLSSASRSPSLSQPVS